MKSPNYPSIFVSRVHLLILVWLLLAAGQTAFAGAGAAFTGLSPVLECVVDNGNGSFKAYFGYDNGSSGELYRAIGPENKFWPDDTNRGQPTTFRPGRHFHVFSVDFSGSVTWTLDGQSAAANATSPVCKMSDLELDKTVDNTAPKLGENVVFTLTLGNDGPNSGLDVQVTDVLPAGLSYVSSQASQGTYTAATGLWNVGAIAKGTSATLKITAKVTVETPVTNTAEVSRNSRLDIDSKPANNVGTEDDQDTATVMAGLDDGAAAGVCYVVADNKKPGGGDDEGHTDVLFRINPLSGTEYEIGLSGTTEIEAINYENGSGTLFAIERDQLGVLNLSTGVFSPRPHTLGSGGGALGTITFEDVDGLAFDPKSGRLYGSVRRNDNKADLLIRIDPATGKAVPNAFGTGVAYVVIDPVRDDLHDIDDLAFDNAGQLYGTANNDGYGDHLVRIDKLTGETEDVSPIKTASGLHLEDFEAFTSAPDGTLLGVRGGGYKEIYAIDGTTGQATYLSKLKLASDYESIACNVQTVEEGKADLELEKEVDEDRPMTGGNLTYTITLTNKGPKRATGVEVRDKLPTDLIYAQHHADQGTYDPATGLWKVGGLDAWETVTLKIVAQVKAGAYDPIENTAEVVRSNQPDPDSTPDNHDEDEDDQDSVTITPIPHDANLCIQKWVDHPAPNPGDEVTFTIRVCNDPADFKDIVVVDQLPEGLVFLSLEAETGTAKYDSYTHKITWNIPLLAFAETTTLKVRVIVDTDYSVENCARITQSTPPDHPGDNKSCASVTPGQSSGGGDAGVESDGNLATKLAQRLFNRRQDAQAKAALQAAPAPVPFHTGAAVPVAAGKTAATSLSAFIPDSGPVSTTAYVVTPADLLGITNATSVFAADYLRPSGRRMAAVFGATSPGGVLYDHAKATCDRLGGGRLEAVRTLDVDGRPFVLSRLVHRSGATDYSVSFVAYVTDAGLVVDSRFTPGEYEVPAGAREVLNLQVWSVAPDYTAELVSGILALMAQEHELTFLNTPTNAPAAPSVFVMDGQYAQGRLALRLVNRSGASGSVVVRGTAARTESDAEAGIRTPFEQAVALPEATDESEVVSVEVEVGAVFDATFEVEHAGTGSLDKLYYADGAWSYTAGAGSRVDAFNVTAQPEAAPEPGRLALERTAQLTGQVSDWASLFRYLRPGGQPADVSAYQYVEFFARGTGQVQLVLEKASIQSWDQYSYTFALQPEGRTYRVRYDELARTVGGGGFSGEDVTLAAFYVLGGGSRAAFDLEVRDLAFGGGSTNVAAEEERTLPAQITLGQNYPNPFNPATTIGFDLPETMAARLAVYDLLGREVAVLADEMLAAGRHEVAFDAGLLPSGAYLYRLVTPHQTLTGKMVLMK